MSERAEADYAIIIPARFASVRFPGKPLVVLRGADGAKTLVQRSWEAACSLGAPSGVWVATDDGRIADEVAAFGGKVLMTSADCRNGTERCAEAAAQLDVEFVVNLQGDAPLTPVAIVEPLIALLASEPACVMATPGVRCLPSTYAHLLEDERMGRVGGTSVVFDQRHHALYFSKRLLPYLPLDHDSRQHSAYLHLGLYVYRRKALTLYAESPPGKLEMLEGLEQLRFLETGHKVAILPVEPFGWDPIELNNPSDVPIIEKILTDRGLVRSDPSR